MEEARVGAPGPRATAWDADGMRDEEAHDRSTAGSPRDRHRLPGGRRLSVQQLSAGIYGTLVSSATMAGIGDRPLGTIVISVLTTILVYWIAEEYASGLAHRAAVGRHTASDVLHGWRESFTMVEATVVPLLAVLAARSLGAAASTAVTVGLLVAAGSLTALGIVAARRSGLSAAGTMLSGLLAAALGSAVVLLELALH
jgi:hypothetical protein